MISELMHMLRGDMEKYNPAIEEDRVRAKTVSILENGLVTKRFI